MKKCFSFVILFIILTSLFILSCEPLPDGFETYTLTVNVNSNAFGTISKEPNKKAYKSNEIVGVLACAFDGYEFDHWEGDITGTDNPAIITMDNNKNISAIFKLIEYAKINVKVNGISIINGSEPGYDFGNVVINSGVREMTFTIENLGTIPLNITDMNIKGDDSSLFSLNISSTLFSVPVGGNTSFKVYFTPEILGGKFAILNINSNNEGESLFSFVIRGTITGNPSIAIFYRDGLVKNSEGTVFDFGNISVDSESLPMMFTIENNGEGPLYIDRVRLFGENATDFSIDDGMTSSPINIGDRRDFFIKFSPISAGSKNILVMITSNDQNTPLYVFKLTGTGIGFPKLVIEIDPCTDDFLIPVDNGENPAFDYGTLSLGFWSWHVYYMLRNEGSANLIINNISFKFSDDPQGDVLSVFHVTTNTVNTVLAPGETTYFDMMYKGMKVKSHNLEVTINTNDPVNGIFKFNVIGTTISGCFPDLNVIKNKDKVIPNNTPIAHNFGYVNVGEKSNTIEFILENVGLEYELVMENITLSGEGANDFLFDISDVKYTLGPLNYEAPEYPGYRGRTPIRIAFNPKSTGLKAATVTIISNDHDENPYRFTIVGEGVLEPEIEVLDENNNNIPNKSTCSLGFVALNQSKQMSFMLNNTGVAPLTIGDINLSGNTDQFSINNISNSVLNPGNQLPLVVSYNPTTIGEKRLIIYINNSDKDENPYELTITGFSGDFPDISVEQSGLDIPNNSNPAYDFGDVFVNPNSLGVYNIFTIRNDGVVPLVINSIGLTGVNSEQFRIDDFFLTTPLLTGESTTFKVNFKPKLGGGKSATVVISSNDPDEKPFTFVVVGNGLVAPEINIANSSSSIQNGANPGFDFDMVDMGTSSNPEIFTIFNLGNDVLRVNDIRMSSGESGQFILEKGNLPINIPAGGKSYFTIAFSPSNIGTKSTNVIIESNDSDESQYSFIIKGTAPLPTDDLIVFPGDFGDLNEWRDALITFIGDEDLQWFNENGGENNVLLIGDVRIWVTFAFEEAGYKNRIGYYAYDNPPTSLDRITPDDRVTLFNNSSAVGSGGDLNVGDSIYVGEFNHNEENQSKIAFWLHQNGFNYPNNPYWWPFDEGIYGTDDTQLNVDSKQHIVAFSDKGVHSQGEKGFIVFGFEDLTNLGDRDFDDIIMIITIQPLDPTKTFEDVVDTTNMVTMDELQLYLDNK